MVKREILEEIGIEVALDDPKVEDWGLRSNFDTRNPGRPFNNLEIQHVTCMELKGDYGGIKPNRDDVGGIARIPLDQLIKLMSGTVERIDDVDVMNFEKGGGISMGTRLVGLSDFYPDPADAYIYTIALLIERLVTRPPIPDGQPDQYIAVPELNPFSIDINVYRMYRYKPIPRSVLTFK